jgi:hypothetical protein
MTKGGWDPTRVPPTLGWGKVGVIRNLVCYNGCDTNLLRPLPTLWVRRGLISAGGLALDRHVGDRGLRLRRHRALLHVEGLHRDQVQLAALVLVEPVDERVPVRLRLLVLEPDAVGVDHAHLDVLALRGLEREEQPDPRLPADPEVLRQLRLRQELQHLPVGDVELGLAVLDRRLGDAERDLHGTKTPYTLCPLELESTGDHIGLSSGLPFPRDPLAPPPRAGGAARGSSHPPPPPPAPPVKAMEYGSHGRGTPREGGQLNLQREVHFTN